MSDEALKRLRDRLATDARLRRSDETQAASPSELAAQAFAYQKPIPDDLWIKCPSCSGVAFREDFEAAGSVCSHCGHHYRIDVPTRLRLTVDPDSFIEWDRSLTSANPIDFAGYPEKLSQLSRQTGLNEAFVGGRAAIDGQPCAVGAMDSRFLMGSMGSVVGEKIARLFELAMAERLPVVLFSASGGARMQEGIISLMQMAKTAAAVSRFQAAGLLYISVLTDPTTGGVTASFASLGDLILSEPGTLIGFAGRRVIEGTIAQALPERFQRAEFLLEHGFLDAIIARGQLRRCLGRLLALHAPAAASTSDVMPVAAPAADPHAGALSDPRADPRANPSVGEKAPRRSGAECLDLIRNKNRPVITDYLPLVFDEVFELHGDRRYADDPALWCGVARLAGRPVTVIGHRKGRTIDENSRTNFGMPHPEGYRKALRLMRQAARFGRPIVCLIDTPGAFCGVGAEERGQGEAIADNLRAMFELDVPIIAVVTGEGGSGGALAIGVSDRLAMFSNALYSVISPRGFASLLWKDPTREREAADILRITAGDLLDMGICDRIIEEPAEGAHSQPSRMAGALRVCLIELLEELDREKGNRLEARYQRYRRLGVFHE